ncbi:putative 3, 5-cyclic nucleotide phosphodiesterase [Trypanosoma grayi]|uniref:putative 3, 5-cyclic nucleotide phosphodiesterase n=1 Tax=Trypanosoma grayi TaxID=71804 RepID=UPI0004F4067F|nr:putative 3, 5-cyclic nucleotide phosphodiesterase [Trypanosoma grayi]KEG10409.1 putative 3, 5-cyclic nucleotide phosphodiesterase [Trypanosoma grayi]
MGCGATKEATSGPLPTLLSDGTGSLPPKLDGFSPTVPAEAPMRMPGKEKYIIESGAVAMDDRQRGSAVSTGTLLLFCAPNTGDFTIAYRDEKNGAVFARRFTNNELLASKEAAGIPFPWGPFFKSLASDVLKNKATVRASTYDTREVQFTVVNSKQPGVKYVYLCPLDRVSGSGHSPNRGVVFEYFLEPMIRMMRISQCAADMKNRVSHLKKLECDYVVKLASARKCKEKAQELLVILRPLREESAITAQNTIKLALEVKALERQLHMLSEGQIHKHPLDALYENGGAQYFQHVPQAEEHYPVEENVDQALLACIRAAFPLTPGSKIDSIITVLDFPELQPLLATTSRQMVRDVFEIFRGVDRWDYDTIQLDIITNGNALFYTTYMLLYKMDLVAHFHLADAVLQRFLIGVQAGYHPNPYHNAMHAADVTQINYYIMVVAGLKEKCQLSKEELLAGLLAGAIHDFDHPGLNNNFHTKTNAYLSTLYNDRSILENHHIACVFEMIRNPRYNIFAPLSSEQLLAVRETMIEMVLATDMGNHGRIFKNFQVRMAETTDWFSNKEDVRLALSMSIKMADISNCARPHYIYAEWARNIANEFYNQGDAEVACNLTVSPFMDRRKEIVDFPKGQISFMMYIVIPMVEALSEFLPSLRFALQYCSDNKEAWQSYQEEHGGSV